MPITETQAFLHMTEPDMFLKIGLKDGKVVRIDWSELMTGAPFDVITILKDTIAMMEERMQEELHSANGKSDKFKAFQKQLGEAQVELDPEAAKILYDNLWDLYSE